MPVLRRPVEPAAQYRPKNERCSMSELGHILTSSAKLKDCLLHALSAPRLASINVGFE
jgi:hypothetical protein